MIRTHVIPSGRQWSVRVLGETIYGTFSAVDAEQLAHRYLSERGGGEIVVHDSDGVTRRSRIHPEPRTTSS